MVGEIEEEEDEFGATLAEDMSDEMSEEMSGELSDELSEEQLDEFEDDSVDLDDDIDVNPKERAARALEIRRALEARDEDRRLSEDLDYLDFDD